MSSATFTAESTATVVTSAKVEMPHIWPTGWPSYDSRKLVGSSQREPISSVAPRSQRFCIPREHQVHWPHDGRNEKTTWSPSFHPGVWGPTAVTTPAPS
jgi:hypothetical protein